MLGAEGRMGSTVCDAVAGDDALELVARVDENDPLDALVEAGAEVAVDFTTPSTVAGNVAFCLEHGIHAVVGTTGWTSDDVELFERLNKEHGANVFIAPNFAVGAVLMMRFAAEAAPFFDSSEIVERHHENKLDAPSGTALRTASLMNEERGGEWAPVKGDPGDTARGLDEAGIRIHSLRVPGSVAHQEVILGNPGETLTIRHDSLDRVSFMPGVIIAVKKVSSLDGVVIGLEKLMDAG